METYDALLASITPDTGETRTILDPATGTAVGEAPVHTVAGPRGRPSPPLGRPAGVGRAGPRRPVRRAPQGSRRRRTLRRRTRPAALPRAGQTAERPQRPLRSRRLRRLAPRRRHHAAGPGNRGGRRRNPRRTALPAHRRRRRHRPLELAHDDHHLADRPRPADGQRRGGQTLRIHPAVRPGPGQGPQRGTPRRPPDRRLRRTATSAPAWPNTPPIGKVMFTGSTATGKAIIKSSADTVKRLTLELGGNDAGIVLPDADPKAIAEGLFWGAFINTGQTCAALKRLYVHDDIYDAVCEELTKVAAAMPMGIGLDENNVLGPLQNQAQYDIVAGLVEAARDSGARILLGGNPDPGPARPLLPRHARGRHRQRQPAGRRRTVRPRPADHPLQHRGRGRRDGQRARRRTRRLRLVPRPAPRPARSPPGSRPAPSGSTSTAPWTPASPSAGPSSPATAWNSASKASKPSASRRSSTAEPHPKNDVKAAGVRKGTPASMLSFSGVHDDIGCHLGARAGARRETIRTWPRRLRTRVSPAQLQYRLHPDVPRAGECSRAPVSRTHSNWYPAARLTLP